MILRTLSPLDVKQKIVLQGNKWTARNNICNPKY